MHHAKRSSHRVTGRRLATLSILLLILLAGTGRPRTAAAQSPEPFDWRANLTCPAEHQVRAGIQYCAGTDETGSTVHVLVVDLRDPDLRFEYVLPKGASDRQEGTGECQRPAQVPAPEECRDPNVPAWAGPQCGCYLPSNRDLYPQLTLAQAVDRAREIRANPPVAAVINADYGAPNETHGPEGLLVVRGERLDGAANCDDDFNAALRPWLALGEAVDPATGLLPVGIGRLATDSSPLPAWLHTGVGGGPMLVAGGAVYDGAATCRGEITLNALEPITNCYLNDKFKAPPLTEGYGGGSCRTAPHTAAGYSADSHWLFFAMSTGPSHPDVLARFMLNQLGVIVALKFDGGGSSQMWVSGATELPIDAGGENRPLTNFVAVHAGTGHGIALPLASSPSEAFTYLIPEEGERATLEPTFRNDGAFTWKAEDGVALVKAPALDSPFGSETVHDLPHSVPPGESVSWSITADSRPIAIYRFRMAQDGEEFGDGAQFLVITIPEALGERRDEIIRQIEAWIAEAEEMGERELEELTKRIQEWLLQQAEEQGRKLLDDCFKNLGALMLLPAGVLLWQRRRSRRETGSADRPTTPGAPTE